MSSSGSGLLEGAAAAAIGAGLSAAGNVAANALSYEENKKLLEQQNEHQLYLWRLNNEYNTPSNQMARYRAAGINPYLALSNGDLGSGTSSSPAGVSNSPQLSAPDFSQAAQMIYGYGLQAAQKRNLESSTGKQDAEKDGIEIDNAVKQGSKLADIERAINEGKLSGVNLEIARNTLNFANDTYQARVKRLNLENDELDQRISLQGLQQKSVEIDNLIKQFNLENILPQQLVNMISENALTCAKTDATYADIRYRAKEIAIAVMNAKTNQYQAETSRMVAGSQIELNKSQANSVDWDSATKAANYKGVVSSVERLLVDNTNYIRYYGDSQYGQERYNMSQNGFYWEGSGSLDAVGKLFGVGLSGKVSGKFGYNYKK